MNKLISISPGNFWLWVRGWACSLGIIALCNFSLFAQPSGKLESAQEYYEQGQLLIQQGEYEKANELFEKAESLLQREVVSSQKPVPAKKKQKLAADSKFPKKDAASVDPALKNLVSQAAKAFKEEELGHARDLYLEAIRLYPNNPDIRFNLAVVYLKQNDFWNAAQELQYVIQLNPQDSEAFYNLGVLSELMFNDNKKARMFYQKYIDLSPQNRDTLLVKSWIKALKDN